MRRRLLKGFSGLAISLAAAMPRQVNDLDLQGEVSLDREWSSGKSCVRVDERKRQGYLRPFWSLISYYKGQIE
jgi:hypothetical protein